MKKNLFTLGWFRLLTAQLPAVALIFLLFTGEVFHFSFVSKIVFGILTISTGLSNYYFAKLIKETPSVGTSPFQLQILISLVFLLLTGICIFRGITAPETYQQIIGYICSLISFILFLLSVWGLKYVKKSDK